MLDMPRRSSTQGYSLTEILDRTFRIYRQNFLPFFALSCLVQIPIEIITNVILKQESQALLNSGVADVNPATLTSNEAVSLLGQVFGFYVVLLAVGLISSFLIGILIYGPIVFAASESHLGRTATLGAALAAVGKRLQSVSIGLFLFYAILVLMGIALVFVLFLCGLGAGLMLYVGLALGSLLIPILMLERTSIQTALGRSWTLGKKRIWVLLAITIGLNVATFLIDLALTALLTQLFRNSTNGIVSIILPVLGSIGGLALIPALPIALTEFYYDQRNRYEGLDIALKAISTPNPSPADVPSPAPGPLLSNDDYLNIALFAIGTLVIVLVLYFGLASLLGPRLYGL